MIDPAVVDAIRRLLPPPEQRNKGKVDHRPEEVGPGDARVGQRGDGGGPRERRAVVGAVVGRSNRAVDGVLPRGDVAAPPTRLAPTGLVQPAGARGVVQPSPEGGEHHAAGGVAVGAALLEEGVAVERQRGVVGVRRGRETRAERAAARWAAGRTTPPCPKIPLPPLDRLIPAVTTSPVWLVRQAI